MTQSHGKKRNYFNDVKNRCKTNLKIYIATQNKYNG